MPLATITSSAIRRSKPKPHEHFKVSRAEKTINLFAWGGLAYSDWVLSVTARILDRYHPVSVKISQLVPVLFLLCVQPFSALAQDQQEIDSLITRLDSTHKDTSYVLTSLALAWKYANRYDLERASTCAKQALLASVEAHYQRGEARALNTLGSIEILKSEFIEAREYYSRSLNLSKKIGDKKGMAISCSNLATTYWNVGNEPEALRSFLMALTYYKETDDTLGTAQAYSNIGHLYWNQGDLDEALKFMRSSLEICRKAGDRKRGAWVNLVLGGMYSEQRDYVEALKNNRVALAMFEEFGDESSIAKCHDNIGTILSEKGDYEEALMEFNACLKLQEVTMLLHDIPDTYDKIGKVHRLMGAFDEALKNHFIALGKHKEMHDVRAQAHTLLEIGETYIKQKNYGAAADKISAALAITKTVDIRLNSRAFLLHATLDSALGKFDQAFEHYKKYVIARDSLNSETNSHSLVEVRMQHDFDMKEATLVSEQARREAIAKGELTNQRIVRNAFIGGFLVVLLFASALLLQRNRINKERRSGEVEKQRSDQLLLNILPKEVADELKSTGRYQPKTFSMVTVLFADFKDFTTMSEKVSAELLVSEIDACFKAFDAIMEKHNIEKIKTVGDAYVAASGLPTLSYTHAPDMVAAALDIREFMQVRRAEREARGELAFTQRIGIHTGTVVAGIVGDKKFAYDIWGDTVNLAARMEQHGEADEINISGSTFNLIKDRFACSYRGKINAKNKGELDMYFVEGRA